MNPGPLTLFPLSQEQTERALELIQRTSEQPARDELILWLGIFAELRAHEIIGLKLGTLIDPNDRVVDTIRIDRKLAKFSKPRDVPMPSRVREALIRFRAAHPGIQYLRDLFADAATSQVREWLTSTCAAIGYSHRPTYRIKVRLPQPSGKLGAASSSPSPNPARDTAKRTGAKSLRPRPTFRKSDLLRAVSAAMQAGLDISCTEIDTNGSIRLLHQQATPTPVRAYDEWKERRDARRS